MWTRLPGIIFIWLLSAFAAVAAPLPAREAFRMEVVAENASGATLRWRIAPGYYLYRDGFAAEGSSGPLSVVTAPGAIKDDPGFGRVEVYHGAVEADLPGATGRVRVTWQGCQEDGICYPPQTEEIAFADADAQTPPQQGLASDGIMVLLAYFGFGLLLAFTPCTFPMVPILLAMLGRQGEALTPGRGALLSGAYGLAMTAAFGAVGAVAGWSGRNLQIALQSPWAIGTMAALFAALAASSAGLFEVRLPAGLAGRAERLRGRRGSVGGAALLGFGSALIVGPCVSAPLAGALLYIAQGGDVARGALALFLLGLGQAAPLMLAGTFGVALLPKAGPWMARVRPVFAALFLAMAIWMLGRIVPGPVTLALWAAFFICGGATLAASGGRRAWAAGAVAFMIGVIEAVGAASGAQDPMRPFARFVAAPEAPAQPFVTVTSYTAARQAVDSGGTRPALVYLTADWCVTCRAIERSVLSNPKVIMALDGLIRIKLDLSKPGPDTDAALAALTAAGPPTMIFLDRAHEEVAGTRLVGPVTTPQMLRASEAVTGTLARK